MNVLIAGDLSNLTYSLTSTFLRERYRVVLVSSNAKDMKFGLPNITVHSVSPAANYFQDIVSAHKFDMVVYIATREEQTLKAGHQVTGQMLDGLLNTLELCRKEGIKHVFYISSTEVYGRQEEPSEGTEPTPDFPNGYTLRTGEQYCQHYSKEYGLTATIVRVPFVYGQSEKDTFLHQVIQKCHEKKTVVFPGDADTVCNFLHGEDVADFILKALDQPASGCQVVNLSAPDSLTFAELTDQLRMHFPKARFSFDTSRRVFTRPARVSSAKRNYDWIAAHKMAPELPDIIDEVCREPRPKKYLIERIQNRFPRFQTYLKWTEVLLGALAVHYLSGLSGSVVEFRFIDFRLAFVILLGIMYGTQVGLIASALVSLSMVLRWHQLGLDWVDLVYNVTNWLPFAIYITAGVVSGYVQDKQEHDSRAKDEQINLVKEKYKFLYDLYQEVSQLKNQFHKQLVGSRDSFGRIFTIAHELDTLEEEEVIFKALHVLEDVMENRNIAIYSIHQASCYARLEIYSSSMDGKLNKSLNLRDLPDLVESIDKGEIFQNRYMKPGYPAYFVPITNDTATVAAVVIWNASFDQMSLYYFNLLKVICGLVQSSINRVALFMDANIDKYYLPNTRILQPEAFLKVLKVKNKMKKNKLGDYLLVMVMVDYRMNGAHSWDKLYTQISGVTRAEDYIGLLGDGNCYILFSQADHTNMNAILTRLAQRGIACQSDVDQYPISIELPVSIVFRESAVYESPVGSVSGATKKTGPLFNFDQENPAARMGTRPLTPPPSLLERNPVTGAGENKPRLRQTGSLTSTDEPCQQDPIIPHTGNGTEVINPRLDELWDDLTKLSKKNRPGGQNN